MTTRTLMKAIYITAPVLVIVVGTTATMLGKLVSAPPAEVTMAAFATSLEFRSPNQRHNARLAAERLNGAVIPPGGTFSYNHTVDSWSLDQGFAKAPVSYDGMLIPAFGGGVCQTSTTLYCAALNAGLDILERHPHVFRPDYASPGQDAAVAFPGYDLRLRNPYSFPIRFGARAVEGKLEVKVIGYRKAECEYYVYAQPMGNTVPEKLLRTGGAIPGGRNFLRTPGHAGGRYVTYRVTLQHGKETKRQRLSDDNYESMNEVISYR